MNVVSRPRVSTPIFGGSIVQPYPPPATTTTTCPDGATVPVGQPCPSTFAQNNLIPAAENSMNVAWDSYSQGCPTGDFANGNFDGPAIVVKMSGFASLPSGQIAAIIAQYTPFIVTGVQGFAACASLAADAAAFIAQHYAPASGLAQQAAAQAKIATGLAPIVANQGTGNNTYSPWGNTPWCWANGQALSNGSSGGTTTESFCPNLAWLQNGWAVYQAAEAALNLAQTALSNWIAFIASRPTSHNVPILRGLGGCSQCAQVDEWGIARYHADDANDELRDFGIAQAAGGAVTTTTATPTSFPTLATVGGVMAGALVGTAVGYGIAGGWTAETGVAAGLGGVAGGALGYYMGKPATTS